MNFTPEKKVDIAFEERQLMVERARQLARPAVTVSSRVLLARVSVVAVGQERFGIPVEGIREMIPCPYITSLPGLPFWMPGVVSTRSGVVCVLDLGRWFGTTNSQSALTHIVLLEGAPGFLSLGVDGGGGFRDVYVDEVAQSLIEERVANGLPIKATTNELLTVLDLTALFEMPEIRMNVDKITISRGV